MQFVGYYLVFASLIVPALMTKGYAVRSGLGLLVIIGVTGHATGLVFSALLDLPSGAVIALRLKLATQKIGMNSVEKDNQDLANLHVSPGSVRF